MWQRAKEPLSFAFFFLFLSLFLSFAKASRANTIKETREFLAPYLFARSTPATWKKGQLNVYKPIRKYSLRRLETQSEMDDFSIQVSVSYNSPL